MKGKLASCWLRIELLTTREVHLLQLIRRIEGGRGRKKAVRENEVQRDECICAKRWRVSAFSHLADRRKWLADRGRIQHSDYPNPFHFYDSSLCGNCSNLAIPILSQSLQFIYKVSRQQGCVCVCTSFDVDFEKFQIKTSRAALLGNNNSVLATVFFSSLRADVCL